MESKKAVFKTSAGGGVTGTIEQVYDAILKHGCNFEGKACTFGSDPVKAKVGLFKWAETAEVNSSVDVLGEIVSRIE
ncbi:MAG TPA: hypothetical protein PKX58_07275 [Flexilinea sp.]|mgnify:CR=1 FL=1|jgi:hypothetical protein|nr:hypothetical protein [Flexilinea sp.]HOP01985.1 hypothetical protein [Flexilinea sp.]HPJ64987.1 hypothetical protein [Flexilinea sp.]HPR70740.1 hypothetical protein [Flexilinea sp.]HPS47440.1 hypothetical protein [Flexilinea sp.]